MNLRVGELLEGGVAGSTRVDLVVGVVDSAEQDGECLFQEGQRGGMVGMGHLVILWCGDYYGWPTFYLVPNPRNTHLVSQMLPSINLAVPLFVIFSKIGLVNSYTALL